MGNDKGYDLVVVILHHFLVDRHSAEALPHGRATAIANAQNRVCIIPFLLETGETIFVLLVFEYWFGNSCSVVMVLEGSWPNKPIMYMVLEDLNQPQQ
jgi:hypothetical protein